MEEDKQIFEEMIEHDFVVRMPPKKKYTVELEITSIKRGKPSKG